MSIELEYKPLKYSFKCAEAILNGVKIEIHKGSVLDLREINAECIVNAANNKLEHNGGLAGQIAAAAGAEMIEECKNFIRKKGYLSKTECLVTTPGRLTNLKNIIHVAGPIIEHGHLNRYHIEELTSCIQNSIEKANELNLSSIAIPGISCGIFGFPKKEAAQCHLNGFEEYAKLSKNPQITKNVWNNSKVSQKSKLSNNPTIKKEKIVKSVYFLLFTDDELSCFVTEFLSRMENFVYDYAKYFGIPSNQSGLLFHYCTVCSNLLSLSRFHIDYCHKQYCDFCVYRYSITNCFICQKSFNLMKGKVYCRLCLALKEKKQGCCLKCMNVCSEHNAETCSYCQNKIS